MEESDSRTNHENGAENKNNSRNGTPTTITYHKLSYTVPIKQGKKTVEKCILDQCTGVLRPGLNAILGPSGSGKTSLISVLAGACLLIF